MALLKRIADDGRVSEEEITELRSWLERCSDVADFPSIHFLREQVGDVLADGFIDEMELAQLHKAIQRVLPKEDRGLAKAKQEAADQEDWKRKEAEYRAANPATDKQRAFIRDLRGACPRDATKEEASEIIEELLSTRPPSPTNRQMMVLRFWNRLDLARKGVEDVSMWMDSWYSEDRDRLAAWELWKIESGDRGGRSVDKIETVVLGIGSQFLARIKRMDVDAVEDLRFGVAPSAYAARSTSIPPPVIVAKRSGCLSVMCMFIIAIAAILYVLRNFVVTA